MLKYLLRRILLAIPTLLIISLATFALSRLRIADSINISFSQDPAAYLEKVKSLGLAQPTFYFSWTSAAFPDTLHRVFPLEMRKELVNWTWQNGNYTRVHDFYQAISTELEPSLQDASGAVLIEFKALRHLPDLQQVPALLAGLQRHLDTLQKAELKTRLQTHLVRIRNHYEALSQHREMWKLYLPALHWHGLRNQYHQWLSGFITGNPGTSSVTGNSMLVELRPRLLITLLLNGMAMMLAFLVGVPLGVFMARRQEGVFDRWLRRILLFFYAMPVIWLGSLLIVLFSRKDIGLGLIDGMNAEPWLMSGKSFGRWAIDNWQKFILPVLTLSIHALAILAMQMRSSVLVVVQHDFIRTARAKGLSENLVYWRHAFRNALFPIITLFASFFPAIFGGSLVVEYLFDFPGMGIKMESAFINNDYAVLFAMVMFAATITILANILADLLYAWADPRVRLARR